MDTDVTLEEDVESLKLAMQPSYATLHEEIASTSCDVDETVESDDEIETTIVELRSKKIKEKRKKTIEKIANLIFGMIDGKNVKQVFTKRGDIKSLFLKESCKTLGVRNIDFQLLNVMLKQLFQK